MKNLLRYAVQLKRQKLINRLIKAGIYKKNNKHLYELTLTDLEKEYKYFEQKQQIKLDTSQQKMIEIFLYKVNILC